MNETELYQQIGQRIKFYRMTYNLNRPNSEKLTQERLAEQAGVSVSLIGNLESEHTPQGIGLYNLWKISEVLGVPIGKFFE